MAVIMRVRTKLRHGISWLRRRWLFVVGFFGAAALLSYRLASLPVPGRLSSAESSLALSGGNWHHLLHEPFYLPYRWLAWLSRQVLGAHPTLALRLPSVFVALVALFAIIYTLRRWYGPRTAFFGFIIMATSAIFLHLGRLATVDVVYFAALPLILLTHVALLQSPGRRSLFGWLLVAAVLLYVPGLIWFVLLQVIWQRKLLVEAFQRAGNWLWQLFMVIMLSVGLAPLAYGFFKHLHVAYLLNWLGLPATLPTVSQIIKNLATSLGFIFFRTPADPSRWLGRLPLLSAFMLVCLIAGIFFYAGHWRAERTRLLAGLAALSILLLASGGPVVRSILVPLVYIVSFGGLAYLLHYWLGMFPRNVTARWLGIGIVCLALALTVTYDLRHYYVAWAHNQDTHAAFANKPPQP
jgi:hypothetical protein